MSGRESEEGENLEYTPTWVVAVICTVIVFISLALERLLHHAGIYLKKKGQKPLFEALQKVKEELMLLGFISLLLTVSQNLITKICVHKHVVSNMLPCALDAESRGDESNSTTTTTTEHFQKVFFPTVFGTTRHLLSEENNADQLGYCAKKGKVPLLSVEAIHQLHIFIFVLAIVHVVFCVLTVVFGGARIRQWQHWESSIAKERYDSDEELKNRITHVHQHTFIQERFLGIGKDSVLMGWVHSFFKQFYASVTKSDYKTLRLGFIMTHFRGNPEFNFHKYMLRALEDDFKQVVGISWYLWVFVVIFLLLNINGWHAYFWIAFIPFILLIAVGTKLEHVIMQLAQEVAEKHAAVEGDLVVRPSDEHFWFDRPQMILFLIHFILFQNAFEIAFFFWILLQYGWDSCIMGKAKYIIPRLVIGVIIQVLCSYSTLPLYAIVTQMGSHFKKAIFDEHVQVGIRDWADKVRKRNARKGSRDESTNQRSENSTVPMLLKGLKGAREGSSQASSENDGSSHVIQLGGVPQNGDTS